MVDLDRSRREIAIDREGFRVGAAAVRTGEFLIPQSQLQVAQADSFGDEAVTTGVDRLDGPDGRTGQLDLVGPAPIGTGTLEPVLEPSRLTIRPCRTPLHRLTVARSTSLVKITSLCSGVPTSERSIRWWYSSTRMLFGRGVDLIAPLDCALRGAGQHGNHFCCQGGAGQHGGQSDHER